MQKITQLDINYARQCVLEEIYNTYNQQPLEYIKQCDAFEASCCPNCGCPPIYGYKQNKKCPYCKQ